MSKSDFWTVLIKAVDFCVKPLIFLTIILLLVEIELSYKYGWTSSKDAPPIFLIAERFIAGVFTLEILIRTVRANPLYHNSQNSLYPFNIWGLIDILAVLPFWLGFICPVQYLGLVRSCRILRALKLFRYSRGLQLTALKFYRAYHNMKGIVFSTGLIWLFFALICFELERNAQPEKFNSLLDAAWFTVVTGTTVGYGDISPVTFAGKVFVGLMLIPIIGTIGMVIAAFTSACDVVQKMEDDPNIDPIEEWHKEKQKMKEIRNLNKDYQRNILNK